MSKYFYAVHAETGKRWNEKQYIKDTCSGAEHMYLVMYDSGRLGVVWEDLFHQSLQPLDPKIWKLVVKETFLDKMKRFLATTKRKE